ncbi:conserved repeat domain-containing protein [Sphingomonas gellani]|uniref:Conserved repeat domain-containing protein n=1 Tax=Sphingomonas gellani TaxID=1166340 RepID=A0A1H8B526_9SPHN|nr:DUF11 domain-containing protein [Sphingomonas gellani]SEM76967.1 conserved repeat domain-containing protein [Sphingomonas gellani]
MPIVRAILSTASAVLLTLAGAGVGADSPARGQTISNTARLTFSADGNQRSVSSNTVSLSLPRVTKPTRLTIRHPGPHYQLRGVGCTKTPTLTTTPSPVSDADLAETAPLVSAQEDDVLIFVLEAPAENKDPARQDTARIEFEAGRTRGEIVLTETSANSGVFAGGLPATAPGGEESCGILITRTTQVRVHYVGSDDSAPADGSVLIDPEGEVFDSRTGVPVDGAIVTLIDEDSGQPAAVVGDDGVSAYPSTVVTGSLVVDARGDRYQMGRGRFRFPLVAPGRYRLKVQPPPGYVAPSRATPAQIADLPEHRGRFRIMDASYGGVLIVEGVEPIRVDVPIDPPGADANLVLDKVASTHVAAFGDFVQYRLDLRNTGSTPARDVTIIDRLPPGLHLRPGSIRGLAEPQVTPDGRELRFAVPALAAGAATRVTYLVEVTAAAPTGDAINRATAVAPGLGASNEASAAVRITAPLFTDAMTITGRVTAGNCGDPASTLTGMAGIRLMLEDGSFVVTDRDGLYHLEGVRPGTHVVQVDRDSVPATHAPVVCGGDTRAAGDAASRFVTGGGGSLHRVDFQLRPTGAVATPRSLDTDGTPEAEALAAGNRADWLARAQPGIGWLFPEIDHNPRAPAVRVVIRHLPGQRVALRLNGAPVDPLRFEGTESDPARGVAISSWSGLSLHDRDNRLEARVLDAGGAVVATLDRTVHYANVAARASFVAAGLTLVADGLTRPLVAVRVTDRDGRPVRAGTPVPFRVEAPYLAWQEAATRTARPLSRPDADATVARVTGDAGLALIPLQPTRQAGLARIAVVTTDRGVEQVSDVRAWLAAPLRDWVVVGFGRGTIGHDALSHAAPLPSRARGPLNVDGQLALYAKGRIKGSWLLTTAYDSDRRRDPDRGLLGMIDPDRYYTVYGDGTLQGHDAATRGKLYVRLERREFYALYGDLETGLLDTRLTRYSRTVNGMKAEYAGRRVMFSAFAARDDSRYGRDEIQGNGLSGPYRLSVRDIVPNSDKLRLETRDRFRSERIVATRQLTRHLDYDIDSQAGTIRFREPILSRDAALNPNFIVVDYEVDAGTRKLAAGGRAALKIGRAEIGGSVLRDQGLAPGATIAGLDMKLQVAAGTTLRAEAASGGKGGVRDGGAWLAEVEHHGAAADVLAYARQQDARFGLGQQDARFGLGQQNAGEAGTRKVGADGRLRLGERLSLTASGWMQDQLGDGGRRVAGEARLEYRRTAGTVFAGVQFATDRGIGSGPDAAGTRTSRLLTLGGTQSLFDDRVKVDGQAQVAVGGHDESVDFPARQRIGVTWKLDDAVRLVAAHEDAVGQDFHAKTSRVGFDVAPWAGAHLLATLNQGGVSENAARTFAQYGLNQSLPIGKNWTVDATLDSSRTVAGRIDADDLLSRYHPPAGGGVIGSGIAAADALDGDFTAATLGASYRADRWSWTGRVEYRDGTRERRWGLTSNLVRTLGEGSTLASAVRAFRVRDALGATSSTATADLALALRPLGSRWSVLERFQLRGDAITAAGSSGNPLALPLLADGVARTMRAVNMMAVNYSINAAGEGRGFEASLFHGAKYVRGRYADETVEGLIDVIGVEVRQDLHPRVAVGVQASVRHSWSSNTLLVSAGPSVGVSPATNMWLTLGYNVSGYRDRDFDGDRWSRRGAYLTMRMKFDQSLLGGRR